MAKGGAQTGGAELVTYIRRDKVQDWQQIQALDDVTADFVFISIDDAERHWSPAETTFPYYELVYVCSGEMRMWMSGKATRGVIGDMFIVKPGVPHREESPPGRNCQLLCLATAFRKKSGRPCHFPLDLPNKVHLDVGHLVERNLRSIASEAFHRRVGYSAAISSYTMQIFIDLVRSARSVAVPEVAVGEIRRRRLVSEAKKYIEENSTAPLALFEIAQHFFMSPYHFSRIFKESAGVSPIAYLTRVRMERAKRLLLDPEIAVKAVAAQIGYNDPHYFTKAFTKEEGVTPTVFRRRGLSVKR